MAIVIRMLDVILTLMFMTGNNQIVWSQLLCFARFERERGSCNLVWFLKIIKATAVITLMVMVMTKEIMVLMERVAFVTRPDYWEGLQWVNCPERCCYTYILIIKNNQDNEHCYSGWMCFIWSIEEAFVIHRENPTKSGRRCENMLLIITPL